ncbi:MAG: response regulator transcription factor [Chloroflexi bacterium]|nr:response regulator transcription factor [Chloroflexota bacterium]
MPDAINKIVCPPNQPETPATEPLTEREIEVLKWIVQGLANQQIAEQLEVSEHTVWNHITRILAKLRLKNRTQAAMYALRQGIVKLEEDL